jgi:hypothetical protein
MTAGSDNSERNVRLFVRDGELVMSYDGVHEYLKGRDHISAFIRALRERNDAYAKCFGIAIDGSGRARELTRNLDQFQSACERHAEETSMIVRKSIELHFNGFGELARQLQEDLANCQDIHMRYI